MANGAGAGYNVPDIDKDLADLAGLACAYKAKAADMRAWYDRISQGTDQEAADALIAKVEGDGGELDGPKALLIIQAMREMTFWGATFAPTYTLDVRGPSSLI
jgi:hypothetical protein